MTRARPRFFAASERGAVMLAALCFSAVLAISIGSYVSLCYHTLTLSTRSAHNVRSIELAETGMEDALWALNNNDWSGWTINGTTATKTIDGFAFETGVAGSVTLQVASFDGSAGVRTITAIGTTARADGTRVSRSLTASSTLAPLFMNAIAATNGTVSFSSAGTVDSYDSSLGVEATPPGRTYSAIIAANAAAAGGAPSVQLTNAQVKGYVASLSPSGPAYGTGGRLVGPSTVTNMRIDPSRVSTSPYQPVFNLKSVSGPGTVLANPAAASTTVIGSPTDTTPQVFYSTGLDLTDTTKIVVNGPVRLVVTGSFCVGLNGGTPSIEITSDGTFEVFVSGTVAIQGGGIDNKSLDPSRLAVYGTTSSSSIEFNPAVPFHGVIYAPNSSFIARGSPVIYGALVARTVSFAGSSPAVHYDVRLRAKVFSGIETPFAVSDWRETTNDR